MQEEGQKKDTVLVIMQNQEVVNLTQEDLILYVIYLYATSRVLAYGGCERSHYER